MARDGNALLPLLLPHDLQVRDVHLPRETATFALVAPFTKGASMSEAACPVLALVAVAARHLPRK